MVSRLLRDKDCVRFGIHVSVPCVFVRRLQMVVPKLAIGDIPMVC
jgi:hypothetical protein